MSLARCLFKLAIVLLVYDAVALLSLCPWWAWPLAAVAILAAMKKAGSDSLSACGTARWAAPSDIPGMLLPGSGLLLGRIAQEPVGIVDATRRLFRAGVGDAAAVEGFFGALSRKPVLKEVRLNDAVHTIVCAPTGVGKGVSCVLPFLMTCEDSCVVVDFKGENALKTSEIRRRMGHEIVILDPFKVVTQ
jgi:type IV secretion system protein VirD4